VRVPVQGHALALAITTGILWAAGLGLATYVLWAQHRLAADQRARLCVAVADDREVMRTVLRASRDAQLREVATPAERRAITERTAALLAIIIPPAGCK